MEIKKENNYGKFQFIVFIFILISIIMISLTNQAVNTLGGTMVLSNDIELQNDIEIQEFTIDTDNINTETQFNDLQWERSIFGRNGSNLKDFNVGIEVNTHIPQVSQGCFIGDVFIGDIGNELGVGYIDILGNPTLGLSVLTEELCNNDINILLPSPADSFFTMANMTYFNEWFEPDADPAAWNGILFEYDPTESVVSNEFLNLENNAIHTTSWNEEFDTAGYLISLELWTVYNDIYWSHNGNQYESFNAMVVAGDHQYSTITAATEFELDLDVDFIWAMKHSVFDRQFEPNSAVTQDNYFEIRAYGGTGWDMSIDLEFWNQWEFVLESFYVDQYLGALNRTNVSLGLYDFNEELYAKGDFDYATWDGGIIGNLNSQYRENYGVSLMYDFDHTIDDDIDIRLYEFNGFSDKQVIKPPVSSDIDTGGIIDLPEYGNCGWGDILGCGKNVGLWFLIGFPPSALMFSSLNNILGLFVGMAGIILLFLGVDIDWAGGSINLLYGGILNLLVIFILIFIVFKVFRKAVGVMT